MAIAIPTLFTKRNFFEKMALEIPMGKAYTLFLAETKAWRSLYTKSPFALA
jgi:hypothetical protein